MWRSAAPFYEEPVAVLDVAPLRFVTLREAPQSPPTYVLHLPESGAARLLDNPPDPYPSLAGMQSELLRYQRSDGVWLTAHLYLPAGYTAADGPLPAILWAYPLEFRSAEDAGQVTGSPYRFPVVSLRSVLPWITAGYAVMDEVSMPVVGEGDNEPNDTYVEQIVASATAAIDEGVRRGAIDPHRVAIAGHSYGAFMAANLLANSDLFRAGIARSGAYNRTLTPFGFQREERTVWDAPDLYARMSPFMQADRINEPLLLIHGSDDENSGTHPLQSERLFAALKGLGKESRLVMLPLEGHSYLARESVLHQAAEISAWLQRYVRDVEPPETD
jgi:dipeptidyl aminopeptidase/acylaminoacyl peptidase